MSRFKSIDFVDFFVSKIPVSSIGTPRGVLSITYVVGLQEGQPAGKIADLEFTPDRPDIYDPSQFTLQLVSGQGDTDNGSLQIIGSELHATETLREFDYRIAAVHDLGYQEAKNEVLNFIPLPTASYFFVDESLIETEPAQLITTINIVPDAPGYWKPEEYSINFVAGTGDTDNGSLSINGKQISSTVDIRDFEYRIEITHNRNKYHKFSNRAFLQKNVCLINE